MIMDIKTIYEDNNLLVVDKPAGIIVFPEGENLKNTEKTLIDYLIEKNPELKSAGDQPRYGIVHRLDKDTSGILLVAKTTETLIFLQNQFINREVDKKYICLAEGLIKEDFGEIKTLIARSKKDPRKQTIYQLNEPAPKSAREAISEYKVIERYEDFTLLEVKIKTGRKHQIRCHLSFFQHPIAGDKLYGFKNSKTPEGLKRQFLHSAYLKIQLPACADRPNKEIKEFQSDLPEDLQQILKKLKIKNL